MSAATTITGANHPDIPENAYDYYKGVFTSGRTVTLSPFVMGKYPVTQELYSAVMTGQQVTVSGTEYTLARLPSACRGSTYYKIADGETEKYRPVEGVTWYDAVYFCNVLSEKLNLTKAYTIDVTTVSSKHITAATVELVSDANGYRLPTEAEWEFAARGGDTTAEAWNYLFSGAATASGVSYNESQNSGLDSVGWYRYNIGTGTTGDSISPYMAGYGTHEVGKKAANALGIYDMSGNVWEWCYDWYGSISSGTETDPTGAASGSSHVSRGGSWINYFAKNASVCYRYQDDYDPIIRSHDVGFRLVRSSSASE